MIAAVAELGVEEPEAMMHHFAASYFHYCHSTDEIGAADDGYDYGDDDDFYGDGDDDDGRHFSFVHPRR